MPQLVVTVSTKMELKDRAYPVTVEADVYFTIEPYEGVRYASVVPKSYQTVVNDSPEIQTELIRKALEVLDMVS